MPSDGTAIGFGVFITVLLSATMVVAGLKAGITPGASTLVVLTAWAAFQSSVKGAGGRRFLNLAQVSGSSGMAVVSGVIFTAPLLYWMHLTDAQVVINDAWAVKFPGIDAPLLKEIPWNDPARDVTGVKLIEEYYNVGDTKFPEPNIWQMMVFTIAGSLIGYGFVGISTKKFLSDPTLPAPEAHACNTMVTASAASAAEQPAMGISLGLSCGLSFFLPLLQLFGLMAPDMYLVKQSMANGTFAITMPCSPVYIGIGGLLTLSTAIVTTAGAFTRLVGDASVASLTGDAAVTFPGTTMRWVGGGAMTVGVVFSLIKFMSPREAGEGDNGDVSLLDIPSKVLVMLYGAILGGVVLVGGGIIMLDSSDLVYAVIMILTIFIMASLMVSLGAILSLQIGSSASPVSGTVFVTTLVICLVSVGYFSYNPKGDDEIYTAIEAISYMLVTACVAVSSANDASQDYKTLQLGGIAPRDGFVAQILGLLAGAIVVPISFSISHTAFGLGTSALPAPQGELFATIIRGILVDNTIPWWPVVIGLSIGCIAVAIEVAAAKRGHTLPAMAFAVGLYLPPKLGLGIIWGAGFRYLGEQLHAKDTGKQERTYESILAAAGMITGAAFLDLVTGVLVVSGVSLSMFDFGFFRNPGESTFSAPVVPYCVATVGMLSLGLLLYQNSRHGVPEATAMPDTIQHQLSGVRSMSFDPHSLLLENPKEGTELPQ